MNWTDCGEGCRDDNNNKVVQQPTTRTRSRKCFDSDMKTTLESHGCRGNEAEIESCAIECKTGNKGNSIIVQILINSSRARYEMQNQFLFNKLR